MHGSLLPKHERIVSQVAAKTWPVDRAAKTDLFSKVDKDGNVLGIVEATHFP